MSITIHVCITLKKHHAQKNNLWFLAIFGILEKCWCFTKLKNYKNHSKLLNGVAHVAYVTLAAFCLLKHDTKINNDYITVWKILIYKVYKLRTPLGYFKNQSVKWSFVKAKLTVYNPFWFFKNPLAFLNTQFIKFFEIVRSKLALSSHQ